MATDLQTPGEPPKELPPSAADPKQAPLDAKPMSETEKKSLRAARFGTPLHLSEHEKRQTRAQRFGTGPSVHKTDDSKDSEEQKKRRRAERFGLPAHSAANDEEKKKARLERFSQETKTDTLEEEKRKARATRFAQIPTSKETHENGGAKNSTTVHILYMDTESGHGCRRLWFLDTPRSWPAVGMEQPSELTISVTITGED